jgi:hypothetical protein
MSAHAPAESGLYGLIARFETPELLYEAAEKTCAEGYTRTDAHTPFPIHGMAEALGMKRSKLSTIVLAFGLLGGFGGFYLQYWVSCVANPWNVGGRPLFSWPSWIPVIFECMVLAASLSAIFFMIALNGLPQPHHPIFDAPDFERASNDGFFLSIEAEDPRFDMEKTRAFLRGLGALTVEEVRG